MICVLLPFPSDGPLNEHEVVAYIARSQAQLLAQLEQRVREHVAHFRDFYRHLRTEADREQLIRQLGDTVEEALSLVRGHTQWMPGRYFLGNGWVLFVTEDEGATIMKTARKSVGGSRERKLSASSGVYGYQPQPHLPRRAAQDSGTGQGILRGTASQTPTGPSTHLLRPSRPAAGGGGGGAADVQTPGAVYAFDQRRQPATGAGLWPRPTSTDPGATVGRYAAGGGSPSPSPGATDSGRSRTGSR